MYVCNFSHTKSRQRSLVWPTRRSAMHVQCEKRHNFARRFDLQGHTRSMMCLIDRAWPCKSKRRAKLCLFSHWTCIAVLRVGQTNDLWRDFVCEKLHTYTSSYVKICTWRRPRKSNIVQRRAFLMKPYTLSCLTVDTIQHVETRGIRRSNGKLCSILCTQ